MLPQLRKIIRSQNYNLERGKIIDNHLCQKGRLPSPKPQKGMLLRKKLDLLLIFSLFSQNTMHFFHLKGTFFSSTSWDVDKILSWHTVKLLAPYTTENINKDFVLAILTFNYLLLDLDIQGASNQSYFPTLVALLPLFFNFFMRPTNFNQTFTCISFFKTNFACASFIDDEK